MNEPKQNAPVPSANVIQAKLPGRNRVYIKRTDDGPSFDEPVYAINWFDTKARLIYDFYNLLAVRSVKAVGGAPYFKGRLKKILHGEEEHRRDVLLVVRYPSLRNFKSMLESPFFLLVSLLRVLAVRDFTFGFTKRCNEGPDLAPRVLTSAYAVHHFKGNSSARKEIEELCEENNVKQLYAGAMGAFLSTGDIETIGDQVPCLMDAIVILKAENQEHLEKFIRSDPYQATIGKTSSSFIGIYERVL